MNQKPLHLKPALLALLAAALLSGCVAYPARTVVVVGPPPPPQTEYVPASPGPGYYWVRGHWILRGGRYEWVSGHYVARRQGAVWVEGRYENRPGGYVWVEGYWR
jgi:hypothetical protein